jgi:hypothetical protein
MSNRIDESLVRYCGLYCGDCIRYKSKFSDLAKELKKTLREIEFEQYRKVKRRFVRELQYYKEFSDVLDTLIKLQCPKPCRDWVEWDVPFSCRIRSCCQQKGFQGCWECDGMEECREFEFLEPFHGDHPKNTLRKIRELGLEEGIRLRDSCYIWQCKKALME